MLYEVITLFGDVLADVDPLGGGQFGKSVRGDAQRRIRRSGGGQHYVERLERHVAVDRQGLREAERTNPADRVAGDP